jgi:hypothetical protein
MGCICFRLVHRRLFRCRFDGIPLLVREPGAVGVWVMEREDVGFVSGQGEGRYCPARGRLLGRGHLDPWDL